MQYKVKPGEIAGKILHSTAILTGILCSNNYFFYNMLLRYLYRYSLRVCASYTYSQTSGYNHLS